jgi:DNA-binding CsgD family transcriptional regulator
MSKKEKKAKTSHMWTAAEDALLRELYPDHNNKEIAKGLGVTYCAVEGRARNMGLHKSRELFKNTNNKWTAEDIARLRELYPDHNNKEIAQMLGFTAFAVDSKAHNMGLYKSREHLKKIGRGVWTAEQDAQLRELYPDHTNEEIAQMLGFSVITVKNKAFIMGLHKSDVWSAEDIAQLRELYPDHYNEEVAQMLGFSVSTVKSKAYSMGLHKSREHVLKINRKWTAEQDAQLRELYPDHTNEEIAQMLGFTTFAVNGRAHNMGLYKSREHVLKINSKWTAEQDARLRELYPDHTNEEIAQMMGFTAFAVNGRATFIGLNKSREHLKKAYGEWTAEQEARLRELFPDHTNEEIAQMMGVTYCALEHTAYRKIGLTKNTEFVKRKRIKHNTSLTDGKIAMCLAGGAYSTPEGRAAMLELKPVIEAKRIHIQIERKIRASAEKRGKVYKNGKIYESKK